MADVLWHACYKCITFWGIFKLHTKHPTTQHWSDRRFIFIFTSPFWIENMLFNFSKEWGSILIFLRLFGLSSPNQTRKFRNPNRFWPSRLSPSPHSCTRSPDVSSTVYINHAAFPRAQLEEMPHHIHTSSLSHILIL